MGIEEIFNIIITLGSVITACTVIYKLMKKMIKGISTEDIAKTVAEALLPTNQKIDEFKRETDDSLAILKQSQQDTIRNDILHIYNECMAANFISEHQMFVVKQLHRDYKALNGNSFIDGCVDELKALRKLSAAIEIKKATNI